MKKINILLFFIYLIQALFISSDEYNYILKIQSPINNIGCNYYIDDNYYFSFSFLAITTGFSKGLKFNLPLENPNYAFFDCEVPANNDNDETEITCKINPQIFPVFDENNYTLPINLESIKSTIKIEDWYDNIGNNPNLGKPDCQPEYSYKFTKNNEISFSIGVDEKGQKILVGKGTFEISSDNINYLKLNGETTYHINPYIEIDGNYKYAECIIYPYNENSGNDEIRCIVIGENIIKFFPTLSKETINNEYFRLEINEQIDLDIPSDYYKMTIQGDLNIIGCKDFEKENKKYGFSFPAITSGIIEGQVFYLPISIPNYAFAECTTHISENEEESTILCYINPTLFPIFNSTYILPSELNIIDSLITINVYNWKENIGKNPDIGFLAECLPNISYNFIKIKDEPFSVIPDIEKTHLIAKFNLENNFNPQTIKDLSKIYQLPIFIDDKLDFIECSIDFSQIFLIEIDCTVNENNNNRAKIFPTLLQEANINQYIKIDVYQEINLLIPTKDYTIIVQGGLTVIGCVEQEDDTKRYAFSFPALSTGFTKETQFILPLTRPSYAFAECIISASKIGETDTITCLISPKIFPIFNGTYNLPNNLNEIISTITINIYNWSFHIGDDPIIGFPDNCIPHVFYKFTKKKDEPFSVTLDEKGTKIIEGKGIFEISSENQNYPKLNTSYQFNPALFIDDKLGYADCLVTTNNNDDKIICSIMGEQKALFFPTLAQENSNNKFCLIDIYEEVDIYVPGAYIIEIVDNYIPFNCIQLEDGTKIYGFYLFAITSGFKNGGKFNIYLNNPYYAYAECSFSITNPEDKRQKIMCSFNTQLFPLFKRTFLDLPTKIESIDSIIIKNWEKYVGSFSHFELDSCYPEYLFQFTKNNKKFSKEITDKGEVLLVGKGAFKIISNNPNYLNSNEGYNYYQFNPTIIVDNSYEKIRCMIYVNIGNPNEDSTFECIFNGIETAEFFPTLSEEEIHKALVRIDISEEINILGDSYYKLSILLLICLFLF